MTNPNRQPPGRPTGGQYATAEHAEPGLALESAPSPFQETQRDRRGHDFYPPQTQMSAWPALYATDGGGLPDKPLVAHWFQGGMDFYAAEVDQATGDAFGWVDLGHGHGEWGYFDLPALEETRGQYGLPIERDLDFKAGTTAKECIPKYRDQAKAAAVTAGQA